MHVDMKMNLNVVCIVDVKGIRIFFQIEFLKIGLNKFIYLEKLERLVFDRFMGRRLHDESRQREA
jgi:hypothetical protein